MRVLSCNPLGLRWGKKKSRPKLLPTCLSSHGGDEGIRTLGPHVANVMLSQLSYIPTGFALLARR